MVIFIRTDGFLPDAGDGFHRICNTGVDAGVGSFCQCLEDPLQDRLDRVDVTVEGCVDHNAEAEQGEQRGDDDLCHVVRVAGIEHFVHAVADCLSCAAALNEVEDVGQPLRKRFSVALFTEHLEQPGQNRGQGITLVGNDLRLRGLLCSAFIAYWVILDVVRKLALAHRSREGVCSLGTGGRHFLRAVCAFLRQLGPVDFRNMETVLLTKDVDADLEAVEQLGQVQFFFQVDVEQRHDGVHNRVDRGQQVADCQEEAFVRYEVGECRQDFHQSVNGSAKDPVDLIAKTFKNVTEQLRLICSICRLVGSHVLHIAGAQTKRFKQRDDRVIIAVGALDVHDTKQVQRLAFACKQQFKDAVRRGQNLRQR